MRNSTGGHLVTAHGTFYHSPKHDSFALDIEQKPVNDAHLMNDTVRNFAWQGITVVVKDRKTKEPKAILKNVEGFVRAGTSPIPWTTEVTAQTCLTCKLGEICALMGPSGCGKTTLLNVLARRDVSAGARVEGSTSVNGNNPSLGAFRRLSSYVEQEDALIGSLTVRETMYFAAKLAHMK
jgi:ABC-type multidrug transport system ATPase subunit